MLNSQLSSILYYSLALAFAKKDQIRRNYVHYNYSYFNELILFELH